MTDPGPPDKAPRSPRSRLEDEVLEILVRTDQPVSFRDHLRRKQRARRRSQLRSAVGPGSRLADLAARAGPGTFLVGSLVLAIVAAQVRSTSALLAALLAIASIALLVALYIPRFGGPRRGQIKQWRGRDIDLGPHGPPSLGSLRDRFRRPPRR
jgi:hypothetical protein